jgi:DNA modification methylase
MTPSSNSIKQGDIFRLGKHLLLCGDSRDKDAIARLLSNKKIKAVITDPPYGVDLTESKKGLKPLLKNKTILNDHLQSDAEYEQFTKDWIDAIKPHLEKKNAFYIFNSDKKIFALRNGMISAGMKFAQLLIWVKTHAVIGRLDYAPQHELIAYGWHGTHEFLKSKDKSVIVHPRPNRSPWHPSTKPIGLIRQLVLNSTRIGDVVFDGFLGSGTTLRACEQTKRICIGVEMDVEYCQTTIDLWQQLTGLTAEKIYE